MIESLKVRNFTVFAEAELTFSPGLNVVVGENGTGKSQLLRLLYAVWRSIGRRPPSNGPTKADLQRGIAESLQSVLEPDALGRLVRRRGGSPRCEVMAEFGPIAPQLSFSFATNSRTEVSVDSQPDAYLNARAVLLPGHELLSLDPELMALTKQYYVSFNAAAEDLHYALRAPDARGGRHALGDWHDTSSMLVEEIAEAVGSIALDSQHDRFYLHTEAGRVEMPLVAEGWRKLAMVQRLLANDTLQPPSGLLWDEPEANLNPRLVQLVASTLIWLSRAGVQVILATHSLFLMRELDLLLRGDGRDVPARFFGLALAEGGAVEVSQGPSIDDIPEIVSLDEELAQSDRYLAAEPAE